MLIYFVIPVVIDFTIDLNLDQNLPFDMDATHNINITIWHPTNESVVKCSRSIPARTILTYQLEITIEPVEFKLEQTNLTVEVLRNATYGHHVSVERGLQIELINHENAHVYQNKNNS